MADKIKLKKEDIEANVYELPEGYSYHKKTGLCETPINQKQFKVWNEDHSKPDKWQIMDMCQMKPNRALIFEAGKMHRAEPIGGFGSDEKDGRLVLTCFFDVS